MFGFIGNIGPWELVVILLIALIVVGPGKLPEVARSMGKALNEFRKTTSGVKREFEEVLKYEEPAPKNNTNTNTNTSSDDEIEDENSTTEYVDDSIDISDMEDKIVEDSKDVNEETEHNPYQ